MPYWAVARTAPHHERLAVESVGMAGFETFVPRIRVKVGSQWRTTPLFGCYFFVRVVDCWRILERPIGVLSGGSGPRRREAMSPLSLLGKCRPIISGAVPTIDLIDAEHAAVTAAVRRTIETDRFPRAPRLDPLRSALAKLEPAPAPKPTPHPKARWAGRRRGSADRAG
jgi:hypothetical protein